MKKFFFSTADKSVEASKKHKDDQNVVKKSTDITGSGDESSSTHSSLDDKESNKEKEDDKKEDQDVVFVQDVGFTIKIMAPGVEPFDIQVKHPTAVEIFKSKPIYV